MRRRDSLELCLIGIVTAVTYAIRTNLPGALPLGEILLAASGILLLQGLIRDLAIKYIRKQVPATCALDSSNKATCMCMESTLGIFGILAGIIALTGGGIRTFISLPHWFWPVLILTVAVLGYLLKNLVIDWKRRRIRIEHNHESVRF